MKTLKLIIIMNFFIGISGSLSATDLIVEESAVFPNFASIQEAVDSAQAGDRIFVKNKGQNIPWIETVTIDKPLSLLPLDSAVFLLTGGIVIDPDIAQFSADTNEITILGAHIFVGSITTTSASNSLPEIAHVNVVSCSLGSGNIDLDDQQLYSQVSGNLLENGDLTIGYGVVSGNQVNGNITVVDINNATGDTTYVVGNRLINASNGTNVGYITWSSNDNYFYIANNQIRRAATSGYGISITHVRTGLNAGNTIENNTIVDLENHYNRGIYFSLSIPGGAHIRIENNVLYDEFTGESSSSSTEYAINFGSISSTAVIIVNYNVYANFDGTNNNGLTNISLSTLGLYTLGNINSTTLNAADIDDITGACSDTDCIDMGSPENRHTDLDLTRNDRGTAGGSFHYDNFFPILTGGARVYLVKTPRTVVQGATIDAEASGYDR